MILLSCINICDSVRQKIQGGSDAVSLLRNGANLNTTVVMLECSFISSHGYHCIITWVFFSYPHEDTFA